VSGPLAYDQWIVHQHLILFARFIGHLNDSEEPILCLRAHREFAANSIRAARELERSRDSLDLFHPLRKSLSAWNQVVCGSRWPRLYRARWVLVDCSDGSNRAAGAGPLAFRGWMRWHHINRPVCERDRRLLDVERLAVYGPRAAFSRPEPSRQPILAGERL